MLVVSGTLELVVGEEPDEFIVDILEEGSVIGAYSIFNNSPFHFTARAKTNL
jgi:CRP-like cAMP-binding protein